MKNKLCLLVLSALFISAQQSVAQGTVFIYQGRLTDGVSPANGSYDLRFGLFNALSSGAQQGVAITNSATSVSNGLFAVTLDFGNQFPGADRWLEIGVRTNGGGAFTTLASRQKVTAAPYAIAAGNLVGTLPSSQLTGTYGNAVTFNNAANSFAGTFNGNGTGLTNVNALTLGGLSSSSFWRTTGNAGTTLGTHFLGTTDNQALELKVNGVRALRIEPAGLGAAPNLIGGSMVNFVQPGVNGSFIGGGGSTASSGLSNQIASSFSVIGGGIENAISTSAPYSIVGGGIRNTIESAFAAAIMGGSQNTISNADYSFIGAGNNNRVFGDFNNTIGDWSVIGGGLGNEIISQGLSFIGGGAQNQLGGTVFTGSISGGTNHLNAIAGGVVNWISDGAIAGFVGGGRNNRITNGVSYATVPGGRNNVAAGNYAFAAGFGAAALHDGTFVWADSTTNNFSSSGSNQFLVRASGGVGINVTNPVDVLHVQSATGVRTRTTTTGTGFAGYLSENSLGEWFAGVAPGTNHWYLYENAPSDGARLVVKSGGNVGIGTTNPTNKLHVIGGVSATAFVNTSDRNEKENFAAVSPREVLDKVTALPITTWNFKTMNDGRHMGPMAQDFYNAFGLGGGDTTITSIDPDGVALAAIQGLNEKVEETRKENADLKRELSELKKLLQQLNQTQHHRKP